MSIDRRTFVGGAAFVAAAPAIGTQPDSQEMYGLIGKITAHPGHRDELIRILVVGVSQMPGCLSYIVARDPADPNLIWITEAWESKAAHSASLALPAVRAAIRTARPLIADMSSVAETTPVDGHGLTPPRAG